MTEEEIKQLIPDDQRQYILQSVALVYNKYLNLLPEEGRLVEIGTGLGHSTLFWALAKPKWTIYTVDVFSIFGTPDKKEQSITAVGISNCHDIVQMRSRWDKHGAKNIIQIVQDSHQLPWELPVDVIYIDGDHTYESCKADFLNYAPFLKTNGLVFFDDYFSPKFGVKQFVDEICNQGWQMLEGDYMAIIKKT